MIVNLLLNSIYLSQFSLKSFWREGIVREQLIPTWKAVTLTFLPAHVQGPKFNCKNSMTVLQVTNNAAQSTALTFTLKLSSIYSFWDSFLPPGIFFQLLFLFFRAPTDQLTCNFIVFFVNFFPPSCHIASNSSLNFAVLAAIITRLRFFLSLSTAILKPMKEIARNYQS